METIEIRPIRCERERDEALDLWAAVFPRDRQFFADRLRLDPECADLQTTWVATVDGRVAAAVQIFPFPIFYNGMVLRCGGIGNVGALPEFRGRRLVRTMLNRQTAWMRGRDYDLSLLFTHIQPFYEKEGWHVLPVQQLVLDAPLLAGVPDAGRYCVRRFTDTDFAAVRALYRTFSAGRCGARVRSYEWWAGQLRLHRDSGFLTAYAEGRLAAYLRWEWSGDQVELVECCYVSGHEHATYALLRQLLRSPRVSGVRPKLVLQASEEHVLWRLFLRLGARMEENRGAMWKILSPGALLKKMQPLLSKRMSGRGSGASSLLLRCGTEAIIFQISPGAVHCEPPGETAVFQSLIRRTPEAFGADVLLGTAVQHQEYARLFPKTAYTFWKSDRF